MAPSQSYRITILPFNDMPLHDMFRWEMKNLCKTLLRDLPALVRHMVLRVLLRPIVFTEASFMESWGSPGLLPSGNLPRKTL